MGLCEPGQAGRSSHKHSLFVRWISLSCLALSRLFSSSHATCWRSSMNWDHEVKVLKTHGLTYGEWAVLIALGYALYFQKEKFIHWAFLESRGNATIEEVREAFDRSLLRGWIQTVSEGHFEQDRNEFGEIVGEAQECSEGSVVFTDSGHALWAKISIALMGEDYCRSGPKTCDE